MSSSHLPDEIIREILAPALRVPDEIFRSNASVSPFSGYTESTSALLVVCKSWLRVSTPLLYNVVVLRSKAQAQALERALRGNEFLGSFIKKLRVEGGFGSSMHRIIRLSPNISDIWLQMSVWSSDSVSGLCQGLPLANPQRFIMYGDPYTTSDNASTRKLIEAVCKCFEKWKRLTTIELPFRNLPYRSPNSVATICDALIKSESIKTVILIEPQYDIELLKCIARVPSLELIHVVKPPTNQTSRWYMNRTRQATNRLLADERLKKLLFFEHKLLDEDDPFCEENSPRDDIVEDFPAVNFDPTFVAFKLVPEEVKSKILSNIIYFALLFVDEKEPTFSTISAPRNDSFTSHLGITLEHNDKVLRVNLLLVSKQFHDTALRHYYCHRLLGTQGLDRLMILLLSTPEFGSSILSLVTHNCRNAPGTLRAILNHTTNLVNLSSPYGNVFKPGRPEKQVGVLDYSGFTMLANKAGQTLETLFGFSILRAGTQKSPDPIYKFAVLRELEWDSSTQIKFETKKVPAGALACLESLTYTSVNDTFLKLLGCMTLPALRHVTFPAVKKMYGWKPFLTIHGSKLETLKIDAAAYECWALCPSISEIWLSGHPNFGSHANVTRIILTKLVPREQNLKNEYVNLEQTDFGEYYPSLEEIQVITCKWPTTERDISRGARSNWVRWSEKLMKWNVKLTDGEGKHWRPRLK